MKQFQVPREEMTVRISLFGGGELEGALFFAPSRPGGARGNLGDRLNDSESFLPLAAAGGNRLLNKDCVLRIELGDDHVGELPPEGGADYVPVRATLVDGTVLEGRLVYAMPPGRKRVLDFLNSGQRFLPLVHDGGLAMINRDAIVEVAGDTPDPKG